MAVIAALAAAVVAWLVLLLIFGRERHARVVGFGRLTDTVRLVPSRVVIVVDVTAKPSLPAPRR